MWMNVHTIVYKSCPAQHRPSDLCQKASRMHCCTAAAEQKATSVDIEICIFNVGKSYSPHTALNTELTSVFLCGECCFMGEVLFPMRSA